jgi:hypothetical protein
MEIQSVLNGGSPGFGTPSNYLSHFRELATTAFLAVKDRLGLTPAQIQRLFPDAKDPVSTISRWRH